LRRLRLRGSADRVKIGEDVSERLGVTPARFRVPTVGPIVNSTLSSWKQKIT
jgi:hypothetical protein